MRQIEKTVLLQTLDHLWREHLGTLEHLRQVVGLRGYGQRDPLNEYKTESFTLFERMLDQLRSEVTGQLMNLDLEQVKAGGLPDEEELPEMEAHHEDPLTGLDEFGEGVPVGLDGKPQPRPEMERAPQAPVRSRMAADEIDPANPESWGKVRRNAPCPCGSGKKYKHCHGRH